MKVIVAIFILLFLIGASGCRIVYVGKYFSKPAISKVSGEVHISELHNPVSIVRDSFGIPHIYASDEHDLLLAFGYVQAQDRLWEMELVRRIATGTLSEVVGDQKIDEVLRPARTTLEADRISRVLGFKFIGEEGESKLIDRETRERLEAFCAGINEFIKQHEENLPLEFRILNFKPEPWRPAHVISVARFLSWGISDNWDVELLRYAIMERAGMEKMWKILPKHKDPGPFIFPREVKDFRKQLRKASVDNKYFYEQIVTGAIEILKKYQAFSPGSGIIPQPFASNNWVVSGKLSESGLPVLANDPHLPHTMPSVFYIVHLNSNDVDVYGVAFPGSPFVNIGHNMHIAWGATTTFADTQDIYIEKRAEDDPDSYIYMGKKEKFLKRNEQVCVKTLFGRKCENMEVLMTRHGPVLNSIVPGLENSKFLFALRWTGYEKTEEDVAFLTLARAKNMEDFKFAMSKMGALVQNWVYADVEGNIGLSVSGLVPIRKNWDGTMPVLGWTGEYEWEGFIPPEEMPQVFNPERGYMVSANNQCVPADEYPYHFSYNYMSSDRAQRIEELLHSKDKFGVEDMKRIQLDDYLVRGKRFAGYFVSAWESSGKKDRVIDEMVNYLKRWTYSTDIDSVAETIFEDSMRWTVINTLSDDIGEDLAHLYLSYDVTIATFNSILENGGLEIFDDIRTPQKETREDILVKSLFDAKEWLRKKLGKDLALWKWGRLHTLTFKHPLGIIWPLDKWFNIGPYPHPGSRETVMAAFFFYGKEPYEVFIGPVLRFVIDMADVNNAQIIIDTGESGLPFTEHYTDLNELWKLGKFIRVVSGEGDKKDNLQGLILRP